MGNISCPGGHIFSDGLVPSPNAWTLISEMKMEKALDHLSEEHIGETAFDEVLVGTVIEKNGIAAFICPECGRLLVFENGLGEPAASYVRERN